MRLYEIANKIIEEDPEIIKKVEITDDQGDIYVVTNNGDHNIYKIVIKSNTEN